jgi:hypothetical protein
MAVNQVRQRPGRVVVLEAQPGKSPPSLIQVLVHRV